MRGPFFDHVGGMSPGPVVDAGLSESVEGIAVGGDASFLQELAEVSAHVVHGNEILAAGAFQRAEPLGDDSVVQAQRISTYALEDADQLRAHGDSGLFLGLDSNELQDAFIEVHIRPAKAKRV